MHRGTSSLSRVSRFLHSAFTYPLAPVAHPCRRSTKTLTALPPLTNAGMVCLGALKTAEIPQESAEGSNGKLWYDDPRETGYEAGWYIHFDAVNRASGYCITAIEYEVELESESGSILKGHGKERLPPLSPNYSYRPSSMMPDDEVHFSTKTKHGELKYLGDNEGLRVSCFRQLVEVA